MDKCLARLQQRLLHQHSELIHYYSNYLYGEVIPIIFLQRLYSWKSRNQSTYSEKLIYCAIQALDREMLPDLHPRRYYFSLSFKRNPKPGGFFNQQKFNITLLLWINRGPRGANFRVLHRLDSVVLGEMGGRPLWIEGIRLPIFQ